MLKFCSFTNIIIFWAHSMLVYRGLSHLFWSPRKAFLSLLAILWNSAFKWVYLSFSPLLFASLLSSWETLGWRKHKLESRFLGEISITPDMQMTPPFHPYGRKWRRTKEPLDESERGEWKSWLKAQHSEN